MSDMSRMETSTQYRRTKKACLGCRKKKLKCNGLHPCATCLSHLVDCIYSVVPDSAERRAGHRHHHRPYGSQSTPGPDSIAADQPDPGHPLVLASPGGMSSDIISSGLGAPRHRVDVVLNDETIGFEKLQAQEADRLDASSRVDSNMGLSVNSERTHSTKDVCADASQLNCAPRNCTGASLEEHEDGGSLEEDSRMLQDGNGRLLYLGESASLSYLDTIRRLVERTLGPSDFTRDGHRHNILEGSISGAKRETSVLPDLATARFLTDSFFTATIGVMHLFDKDEFNNEVSEIYVNPLKATQSRLSILNLVFAVGLQLTGSSISPGGCNNEILQKLDGGSSDRAEMFYLNATRLNDPISGFGDGDITSIQALVLITLFMLTVAKRNAAWAYFGMAVRSAYALGLHRKHASLPFGLPERRIRNNVWRTLYVMDCFLSAMLGRPNAISSRDAAESLAEDNIFHAVDTSDETLQGHSFSASVGSSLLIGNVLSLVYAKRKISVQLAHSISNEFEMWKDALPPMLHWQNISLPGGDTLDTLAQLHANLSYFHGIILLTRPFLMQNILSKVGALRSPGHSLQSPLVSAIGTGSGSVGGFSSACVRSALYSIDAVQSAVLKRALPRRDPFVIYWLFTASLIVFSNAFCPVYGDIDNGHAIRTSLSLHRHLSEVDLLARRFLQILLAFEQAIEKRTDDGAALMTGVSSTKDVCSAFFGMGKSNTMSPNVGNRLNTHTSSDITQGHIPTGMDDREDILTQTRAGSKPESNQAVIHDMVGDTGMFANMSGTTTVDYSFDFDAFITSGGQDAASSQSSWGAFFRTMQID